MDTVNLDLARVRTLRETLSHMRTDLVRDVREAKISGTYWMGCAANAASHFSYAAGMCQVLYDHALFGRDIPVWLAEDIFSRMSDQIAWGTSDSARV